MKSLLNTVTFRMMRLIVPVKSKESYVQGPERYCKKCGHRCHCYQPDCKECVNDVCTRCDCESDPRHKTLRGEAQGT